MEFQRAIWLCSVVLFLILTMSSFAQPEQRMIIEIKERDKVLFQGTLQGEELIQIPLKSDFVSIKLLFSPQSEISIYVGGEYIVEEIRGATISVKAHKISVEKTQESMVSLSLGIVPEKERITVLAIYDEEGRPIVIVKKSSESPNASLLLTIRNSISSLQNALDQSPLPAMSKIKYKEALYKALMLVDEGSTDEAENLLAKAYTEFEAERERYERISESIREVRKALAEKASSLSQSRLVKTIELLNSAEEKMLEGDYKNAEVFVAQASSTLNPTIFEILSENMPIVLGFLSAILIILVIIYATRKLGTRPKAKEEKAGWS